MDTPRVSYCCPGEKFLPVKIFFKFGKIGLDFFARMSIMIPAPDVED